MTSAATTNGDDGYMLRRDSQESARLDAQHGFFRLLARGQLVHPSIPLQSHHAVADVAAGTGIWLRQLASSPPFSTQAGAERKGTFVAFDLSAQQFPPQEEEEGRGEVNYVVHDMTQEFPAEYREKFDLVNVRFVSYVLRAADLEKVVSNVIQILRPGGYLQWQECDAGDSWTTPETPMATATINHVIAEKVARGLLPGIATPLIKQIQSYFTALPTGQQNPISFSPDLMRLKHVETISTFDHPDRIVAAGKKLGVISAATVLLEASINCKKGTAADTQTPLPEKEKLDEDVREMTGLMEAIKRGEGEAINNWDFEMTWIVARKAIIMDDKEPWMAVKYPAP